MFRKRKPLLPDDPLCLNTHGRPVSRRDFLAQGLATGLGLVTAPTFLGLFANPRQAAAALSPGSNTGAPAKPAGAVITVSTPNDS